MERSGCDRIRRYGTPTKAANTNKKDNLLTRCIFFASIHAIQITNAILTNSEGCILPITGKTIQRFAPNLATPNFQTASKDKIEPI